MSNQKNYSDPFWLAYYDAIKGDYKPGPSTAIFFAQQGQLGPAAGPGVDAQYTNFGIFQLADNLLRDDSLSYTPSQSNSYTRRLLDFLDNVDLGGQPNATNDAFLAERLKDQIAAQKQLDIAKAAAIVNFKSDLEVGLADPGTKFPQWATVNAPAYNAAWAGFQSASSAVLQAQATIGGPKSAQYAADKSRLTDALYKDVSLPGINKEVSPQDPKSAAELRRAVQTGGDLPKPIGTYYVPEYNTPEYGTLVGDWINASGNSNPSWNSTTINFDKGTKVDKSSFGQTKIGASVSIPSPWFFSVKAGGDSSHSESNGLSHEDQQKTSVTVKWTDKRPIGISSGRWDIKNSGYKLKKDAPESVKSLVRPTQLVFFNNLCYDIQFFGQTVDEVDSKVSDTKSGSAGLTIFGWNVGIEGSASSENGSTSHTASWDKQNGVLSVKPTQYGLSANIGAIIGERLDLSD